MSAGFEKNVDFGENSVLCFDHVSGRGEWSSKGSCRFKGISPRSGKEGVMNWKRFFIASAVVFVAVQVMEYVINNIILMSQYEALKDMWRPDMQSKMWIMYLVGVLVALLFTYIFVKGREGKGIAEGIRYGIIIWLFVGVPMSLGFWIMLPIPFKLALWWIIFSLLEYLVAGILVAAIYKPVAPAPKAV